MQLKDLSERGKVIESFSCDSVSDIGANIGMKKEHYLVSFDASSRIKMLERCSVETSRCLCSAIDVRNILLQMRQTG